MRSKTPFFCIKCEAHLSEIQPSDLQEPSNQTPQEPDITICIYCYAVYTFRNGSFHFVSPSEVEATWFCNDKEQLHQAMLKLQEYNKKMGRA